MVEMVKITMFSSVTVNEGEGDLKLLFSTYFLTIISSEKLCFPDIEKVVLSDQLPKKCAISTLMVLLRQSTIRNFY